MIRAAVAFFAGSLAMASVAMAQAPKDIAGAKDHPLVGRYEGSAITFYAQSDFDDVRLLNAVWDPKTRNQPLNDGNSLALSGKTTKLRYRAPKDRSSLEIIGNFEQSLKSKGFETVFSCGNSACLADKGTSFYLLSDVLDDSGLSYRYAKAARYLLAKASRPTGDVYAAILVGEASEPTVMVRVVELKGMDTGKIAFIDASAMAKAIGSSGHVALYGIEFDYDKAEMKAGSAPTIAEIAKLMKSTPALSIVVAGHTDNQGAFDYNIDLSRRRAASVVAALVREGIATQRLVPFGAGMAAPLAPNDDEAGRAKNRRVEIVKR
jgi:OOP family OmpA-OmpF porin